jgi:hypothetical protein
LSRHRAGILPDGSEAALGYVEEVLGTGKKIQAAKKISVKELESLTGLLNFACKVVVPGRPFLLHLYQLLWGVSRQVSFLKLRLSKGGQGGS